MSEKVPEVTLSKSQLKRQRKKRLATSPLEDTGRHCNKTGLASSDLVNSGQSNKRQQTVSTNQNYTQSILNTQLYDNTTIIFSQYAGQAQSPPPPPPLYRTPFPTQQAPQYISTPQNFPQSNSPPPCASELLDEIKIIKEKLYKIDIIEKTVNTINIKINDIETQVKAMDHRTSDVENAC